MLASEHAARPNLGLKVELFRLDTSGADSALIVTNASKVVRKYVGNVASSTFFLENRIWPPGIGWEYARHDNLCFFGMDLYRRTTTWFGRGTT